LILGSAMRDLRPNELSADLFSGSSLHLDPCTRYRPV
jgi:hypothetical protein